MRWLLPNHSSLSYLISQKQHDAPIVILAENTLKAEQIQAELRRFTDQEVHLFPDWETLPYDRFSPHEAIISDRILSLYKLKKSVKQIVILPIQTALMPVPSPDYVMQHAFQFIVGQDLDREALRQQLTESGYRFVSQVMEHGEFAVRGSVIDLFPMGTKLPIRIELFDNEIDTLRTFDPETQRTIDKINGFELLPAREFPLDQDGISIFRQNWRESFDGNPTHSAVYQSISDGYPISGIEYYLPLFFDKFYSVFDYLPDNCLLIRPKLAENIVEDFFREVYHRYEQLRYDVERPILAPRSLFLNTDKFFAELNDYETIRYDISDTQEHYSNHIEKLQDIAIDDNAKYRFHKLVDYLNETKLPLFLIVESLGRREVLEELLRKNNIQTESLDHFEIPNFKDNTIYLIVGEVHESFRINNLASFLSEQDLYKGQVFQRRYRKKQKTDPNLIIRDLSELKIGDPVTHLQHGIGRYEGLSIINIDGVDNEFITLTYANEDKIYVPVTSLELISRFPTQEPSMVQLTRLGNEKWSRAKQKAMEKIHDVAVELLELYARREAKKGFHYQLDEEGYRQFTSQFRFETTPDQQSAIDNVLDDMCSDKSMDRLVCGDVGFGKTEVAMRAAYIAASNNKQVAILAPTTLLAQQHYENFKDRFANTGANIEVISRFKTKSEQEKALQHLSDGKIDILIGTHRIIQQDIRFKDLGLIIIDEEHRFGVKQKEVLKNYRSNVDILSLTATPIPRTLNMSLSGIRDISIIATPPEKRLAVKTFINKENEDIIKESIQRELLRGGQVFFVHNDIQTIFQIEEKLADLVPEAKVTVAHGQMHERQLEKVMHDFYHRRFNVLICTTIIENGIDIPTANTIIIDRADHFGLSQLHQLRGRVGRSSHQAYAYLIVPEDKRMTADAKKRIEAIQSMDELGSGFLLATHDLEIRGAGEILGEEQSGHIEAIGFTLYMELLDKTVSNIKAGKTISLDKLEEDDCCEISLNMSTIIPENYMPNIQARLNQYKRVASCKTTKELHELQVEFIDRFGLLPDTTKRLFDVTELKLIAHELGITKIELNENGGYLLFNDQPAIDPGKMIKLIQSEPGCYRMRGPKKLQILKKYKENDARFQYIQGLIEAIAI